MTDRPTTDRPNGNEPGTGAGAADQVTLSAAELEELRKKAAQRDEYLNLARRTQADFENYQQRQSREREQDRDYLRGGLVLELLPLLDDLERAISHAAQGGERGADILKGVTMVRDRFLSFLQRQGVTPIEALGQPFDPSLHEALTQQPSPDHPPNTVIHVVDAGYRMRDRVLRPAKVIVSSAVA